MLKFTVPTECRPILGLVPEEKWLLQERAYRLVSCCVLGFCFKEKQHIYDKKRNNLDPTYITFLRG